MGIAFIASSRATFNSSTKTITFVTPAAAARGDVLVALVAHNVADVKGATQAPWSLVDILGSGADVLDVYTRMVGDADPPSVAFPFATVANEWQGTLVVFRQTAPGIVREASASATFGASTTLTTAGVTSQQATSLIMSVWTCAGSPSLSPPAGFTVIDTFSTAVVSLRSMLVGFRVPGANGALTFPPATAGASTTGRSFTFVLRDRIPIQPAPLADIVPGNIGLIAKDTRRAR